MPIDPLPSPTIAVLILRSSWFLVRRSSHIQSEAMPDWLDMEQLKAALAPAVPQVEGVHHRHAWMLTNERPLMTLHANVREGVYHHRA
jgi:cobalt-zinc-cadmium efflux system protein